MPKTTAIQPCKAPGAKETEVSREAGWTARLMLLPNVLARFCNETGKLSIGDILDALGVHSHEHRWTKRKTGSGKGWAGFNIGSFPGSRPIAARDMRALQKTIGDLAQRPIGANDCLSANLAHLARMMGLNKVEVELVAFASLTSTSARFRAAVNMWQPNILSEFIDGLASVLACSPCDMRLALSPDGVLRSAGLLNIVSRNRSASSRLDLLEGLGELLTSDLDDRQSLVRHSLFRSYFQPSPIPRHDVRDFPHLQREIRPLLRLFESALAAGSRGVNILFYGPS